VYHHRDKPGIAPAERRIGMHWQAPTPAPEVEAYQDAMTKVAWSPLEERRRN
jgi:hypothetical protein